KITDACSSSPCENSGQCILSGSNYTCQCSQGFTGLNCETNIDECSSQPCQNNGTCSDGINQFFC
ncbi:calcium-binding EGF-like domain-containing protein, partial [Biomphalaria glabrata]